MSINPTVYAADFGAVADGTDQTAQVQLACDVITARGALIGGRLIVDRGIKFRRDALAMPQNIVIDHYQSDNLSMVGWTQYQATPTEFVGIANGGAVNERAVVSSDYHPSCVVRLDNLSDQRDGYLGDGQRRKPSYNNPARISYWMYENKRDAFNILFNRYGARTPYNDISINAWIVTAKLYGLTGAVIDKSLRTSGGAIGIVKSIGSGYILVDIAWGIFNVGETAALYDFIGETNEVLVSNCGGTITSIVESSQMGSPITLGLSSGAVGFGIGSDTLKHPWGFAGSVVFQLAKDFGQFCPASNTTSVQQHFVNDATLLGAVGVTQSVVPSEGRPRWFKYAGETPGSYVGSSVGPSARCLLRPGGGVFGAENIASVVWGGGYFQITFTRPLASVDYGITFGQEWWRDYPTYDGGTRTVNGFRVYVFDLNDPPPRTYKAPHGEISVTVHGP